jgi:uncharacterized membrane protein YbhN (UPF0104 family)
VAGDYRSRVDPEAPPAVRSRRSWRSLLTVVLLAIVAVFVVVAVQRNWSAVREDLQRLSPLDLLASVAAGAAALAFASEGWRRALRSLGHDLPVRDASTIYFAGQLGKYVPGSLWPVVIQTELGKRSNVPRMAMGTSYFLGLLISLGCGGLTGLLILTGDAASSTWVLAAASGIGALVVAVLVYDARVLNSVAGWVTRRTGRDVPTLPKAGRQVVAAVALTLAAWVCFGLHAWFLARPLGAGMDLLLPVTGAFALAFVAGLVMVPLPAGAGVREAVMVLTLAPSLGEGTGVTVSLLSRLALIVTELLLAGAFGVPSAVRLTRERRRTSVG